MHRAALSVGVKGHPADQHRRGRGGFRDDRRPNARRCRRAFTGRAVQCRRSVACSGCRIPALVPRPRDRTIGRRDRAACARNTTESALTGRLHTRRDKFVGYCWSSSAIISRTVRLLCSRHPFSGTIRSDDRSPQRGRTATLARLLEYRKSTECRQSCNNRLGKTNRVALLAGTHDWLGP